MPLGTATPQGHAAVAQLTLGARVVTDPKRVQKALDVKTCNALPPKANQIGFITEARETTAMSQYAG